MRPVGINMGKNGTDRAVMLMSGRIACTKPGHLAYQALARWAGPLWPETCCSHLIGPVSDITIYRYWCILYTNISISHISA